MPKIHIIKSNDWIQYELRKGKWKWKCDISDVLEERKLEKGSSMVIANISISMGHFHYRIFNVNMTNQFSNDTAGLPFTNTH